MRGRQAVHARHPDVHKYQIKCLFLRHRDCHCTILRSFRPMPYPAQHLGQKRKVDRIVVHHKHPAWDNRRNRPEVLTYMQIRSHDGTIIGCSLQKQSKGKAAAKARRALKVDYTIHAFYRGTRDRQTKPDARNPNRLIFVNRLEFPENPVMILRIDSNTRVTHQDIQRHKSIRVWGAAQGYHDLAIMRELHCVRNQITQH